MKSNVSSFQILLKDLPPEGQDFEFSRNSAELNDLLEDLIGSHAYSIKIRITPQGNTFDLRGEIHTGFQLQCSRCATDFEFPVDLQLHDYLVIDRPLGKGDQISRANHAHEWNAEGPDYILLQSETFNLAEYAHEAIALAEPMRPLCSPNSAEGCQNPEIRVEREWLSYGRGERDESIRANPFRVLEKIKLKS
ncbi:MAG: DUF177 domain-containing protein [Bdellovibrionales bacterium]